MIEGAIEPIGDDTEELSMKAPTSVSKPTNLGKHRVRCLLLPSAFDAQFGTPYPRSAGFDTDTTPPNKAGDFNLLMSYAIVGVLD